MTISAIRLSVRDRVNIVRGIKACVKLEFFFSHNRVFIPFILQVSKGFSNQGIKKKDRQLSVFFICFSLIFLSPSVRNSYCSKAFAPQNYSCKSLLRL